MSNSLDQDQARLFGGLIWVKTVCKGEQQTTKVGKEFIIITVNSEIFARILFSQKASKDIFCDIINRDLGMIYLYR